MRNILPKNSRSLSLGLTFLATAITIHAEVINFTTAEGYVDGNLNGQPSGGGSTWSYSNASAFVVDADGTGSVTSDPSKGYAPAARFTQAISVVAGQTVTLSMDFQFIGLDLTDTGTNGFFSLALSTDDTNPSRKAYASIGHPNWGSSDQYYFQYSQNGGTPAVSIDDSASKMGLTEEGGSLSDHLRMTVKVNIASTGNSTYAVSLYNIDEDEMIIDVANANADLTAYSELYATLNDASTAITVSQISFSSVPEPTSFALLMGGLVGIAVCTRRSRKA